MPNRSLSDGPAYVRLDVEECWSRLRSRSYGRICFGTDDRVQVVLTVYVVRDERLYFRATSFGALVRHLQRHPVTLQVDDMPADRQAAWSVTVTGPARRVDDAETLASLWSTVNPTPWEPGPGPVWVEMAGGQALGQRVRT